MKGSQQPSPAANTANNAAQAVLAAFFPPEFKIADIKIQRVSLASFMALEKVGSPFASFGTAKETSVFDLARAIVILSIPTETADGIEQLRSLMGDLEAFDALVWNVSARVSIADILTAAPVIREAVTRAFSTAIPTGSEGSKNFPREEAKVQVSAGDSPSSTLSATSTGGHSTLPSAPTSPSPSRSLPPPASDAEPNSPLPPTTNANS